MNSSPLTIRDHGNAIMLSDEQSLLAGLNLIAHAAHTLGDYVEQCQNELERARE